MADPVSQPEVSKDFYPTQGGYSEEPQYASVGSTKMVPAGTVIELPYHRGEDGKPIRIMLEEAVSEGDLEKGLSQQFPKTVQNIALQMMDNTGDKVSLEDFNLVMNTANAAQEARAERAKGEPGFLKKIIEIGPEVIGNLWEGVKGLNTAAGVALNAGYTPRQQINALGSIVEGGIRGTEVLGDTAGMIIPMLGSEDGKYKAYLALKDMQKKEAEYQAGASNLPLDPWAAENANKIKNVLDVTVLFPGVSKLAGAFGRKVAEQTIESVAKESSVGAVRKGVSAATSFIAGGIEKGAEYALEQVGKLPVPLGSAGAGIGAALAYEEHPIVATLLGARAIGPAGLKATAKISKAAKWAAEAVGADSASEVIAEGLKAAATQNKSDTMLRGIATFLPPDSIVRGIGQVVDASITGGAIGAGFSGVQAMADPFNTGTDVAAQMVLGGIGGMAAGATLGTVGGLAELTPAARNRAFVREMARDLVQRPENRSVIINDQEISSADLAARMNVLNREDMSTTDKARLFSILKSAEFAGNQVLFVNNETTLPDYLGGTGDNMGKGLRVVNDTKSGRSTILINADQINVPSAIEEVTHAFMSDKTANKIIDDLVQQNGGLQYALDPLIQLGQTYYDTQVQSNPQAAALFKKDLDIAKDVSRPASDRQRAALQLAHEWAANGVAQILKNEDPTALATARGYGLGITKALTDVFAGIMSAPTAPTLDPITGFFYKDGKLIKDPVLEKTADTLKRSIRNGQNLFGESPLPQTRGAKSPVTEPMPGVNVGNKMPDGTTVIGLVPLKRYEDTHSQPQKSGAGPGDPTTKRGGKKERGKPRPELGQDDYHGYVFDQFAQIESPKISSGADALGNIAEGTPVIFARGLDNQQLNALFQIKTHHGEPLILPENQEAVARFNEAAKYGQLMVVDHDIHLGKTTDAKDRVYAVRGRQVLMGIGVQQTKEGGPLGAVYNVTLLNDIANHSRTLPGMEMVDAALKDFNIRSVEDFVPLVKAHIENYSNPSSIPGAKLFEQLAPATAANPKKSAQVMRDLMFLSNGIQPRTTEPYASIDRLKNRPFTKELPQAPGQKFQGYDIYGKEVAQSKLYRDRNVIQNIRLDAIRNVQLYAGRDGLPVGIKLDIQKFKETQRTNFSPRTTTSEVIGEDKVLTDQGTGRKAYIQPNGKTKVYGNDGALIGIYADFTEAQTKLNKVDINEAIRLANSTARSAGAVGAKAITPQYVASTISPGESVLNFGAGKPDKITGKYLHSEIIRSFGGKVEEYDFGANAVGALDKKYNTVFASNVLNVQSTPQMLESTLSQIWDRVNESGRAVFNYPSSPRYLQMTPKEVATSIEVVTGLPPVRVGGTSSAPLWEVSKAADRQADIRFSPKSPAAIARKAEQAKAMRGRMEEETPARILTEWMTAAGQAKQEAKLAATQPAQPQKAKGKIKPSIVEQAAISRQAELNQRAEQFPGYSQITENQRAQFLKDLAASENSMAARALAKIAKQQQEAVGGPATRRAEATGNLTPRESAMFRADVERELAKRDAPILEEETVKKIRERVRQKMPSQELEAMAMKEVSPAFTRRDLGPVPQPTKPGIYQGFEALSDVGLPREQAPQQTRISERVTNLLGTDPRKSMADILKELAKKAADQPKREPAPIDVTVPIQEPPLEIITAIDEPRLPSNMILARTPKGNFKLYVVTTAGKLSQEAVINNYKDALKKAQEKHFNKIKRYATR